MTTPAIPMTLNHIPSPFPERGQNENWQGFSVREKGGNYLVSIHDARVHMAVGKALKMKRTTVENTGVPETRYEELFEVRGAIEKIAAKDAPGDPEIKTLLDWLDWTTIEEDRARQVRLSEGMVTFDEIPLVLRREMSVATTGAHPFGGTLKSLARIVSFFGPMFVTTVEVYATNGLQGVQKATTQVVIPPFSESKPLSSLILHPASEEEKAVLADRGRFFRSCVPGPTLLSCGGFIYQPTQHGMREMWAKGRVVIDAGGIAQFSPEVAASITRGLTFRGSSKTQSRLERMMFVDFMGSGSERNEAPVEEENRGVPIPDEDLWQCWPFLPAFSLRAKAWGMVAVEDLSAVEYRTDAFDQLVFDTDLKETIRDLVSVESDGFSDIVEDKSGGLVFLLHGKTGLGKTLTAEAVAEVLGRPLYSVTVGELGDTPQSLEEQLRKVLDLALRWNAVLLLDEADIFLEARDSNNITRNSMVTIFLRLLDYHSGVLFLTSNRAQNLDAAIHSRIAIALEYPEHTGGSRTDIWTNLLKAAGIKGAKPSVYAKEPLNGRQIKNTIRMAMKLAESQKEAATDKHIRRALKLIHRPEEMGQRS